MENSDAIIKDILTTKGFNSEYFVISRNVTVRAISVCSSVSTEKRIFTADVAVDLVGKSKEPYTGYDLVFDAFLIGPTSR